MHIMYNYNKQNKNKSKIKQISKFAKISSLIDIRKSFEHQQ